MATELRKLRINRVSLVDKGANPGAHVVLFKRSGDVDTCIRKMQDMTGEEPAATFDENISEMEGYQKADEAMSELWPATDTLRHTIMGIFEKSKGDERKGLLKEAIAQYLAHCKEKLAEIAKRDPAEKEDEYVMDAELKKQLDALAAQMKEANGAITTLKADLDKSRTENEELRKRLAGIKPDDKPDTTPVTKADLSKLDTESREAVQKALDESKALREQVTKLQADAALTLEVNRITKQYGAIAEQDAIGYAKLLLKHAKDSDERKAVEKLLDAANKSGEEIMREHGTSLQKSYGGRDGDPMVKLQKSADEIRAANPKYSAVDALQEAYRRNPELAAQIEEER